jgi:flagellar secretion chaperone FliS
MNPYLEQTILSADPVELTGMIYQRAIFCVRDAREHLRHKRIARRSTSIMGAYAALAELLSALRPEMAPELAERLQSLYFYMQGRLLDANSRQIDQPLAEVLNLLNTLAEAWSGVAAELSPNREPSDREYAAQEYAQQEPEDAARLAISA